ncbi:MAG: glycoside hydrolase family 2 protein [Bdellovibrionia bacterium]
MTLQQHVSSSRSDIHPNPQFRRPEWQSLNGPWRFAYDDRMEFHIPSEVKAWTHTIEVPFAPEAQLSGIGDQSFHRCCWYQREFSANAGDGLMMVHFGAVDYSCRVWVNDHFVGSHEGGHSPFTFDITPYLNDGDQQTITVCANDDPADLAKPRGKQDWQLEPHSIWYPRTTGIWQTVWLERVPKVYIDRIRWTPHLERWEIGCETHISGATNPKDRLELRVKMTQGEHLLANDSYQVILGEVTRRIVLSDPGIDDFRNELLWSPERPTLIQCVVQLCREGQVIDEVHSYTALRSVGVSRDRFMLNGRPYYLRLVLDQGYWPESLMTAPTTEAFKKDIELTKAMGFNGVRKHQKVEDPVYLYYADLFGLLVWEEMPSAYRFTHDATERIIKEWTEVIDRDYSHPCIITWVPFNESWGVPDLAEKVEHQSCVQALYHLTRTLDPTRPVIGNDGWESTATDIIGIHDYDANPERMAKRYGPEMTTADILGRRRPAGRLLTIEGHPHRGQPIMLTEFGGIAFAKKEGDQENRMWGYSVSQSVNEFQTQYQNLLTAVNQIEFFSGFCYTQLTDTFQEVNGLLFPDRTPKVSVQAIAAATLGTGFEREERVANIVGVNNPLLLGNA